MKTIIITGKRDAGKTTWCRKNLCGPGIGGVRLDKVYDSTEQLIGYDAVNVETGGCISLLRSQNRGPVGSPTDAASLTKTPKNREEPDTDEKPDERIGRFMVSSRGMREANRWIHDAWMEPAKNVLIDEVGRLELMGRGYAVSLREIYQNIGEERPRNTPSPNIEHQTDKTVYLVARKDFLSEIVTHFRIGSVEAWMIEDGERTSAFRLPY